MTAPRWIGSPPVTVWLGTAIIFLASSCGQSTATNAAGIRPAAPSEVSATAGNASATVSWTAPSSSGSPITGYTVIWSGGSQSCNGSPCLVTALTSGTAYTFTVTATNAAGTGPASAPSNSVTPVPPLAGGPVPAQLLGDWFWFVPAAVTAVGGAPCPSPPTHTNCFYQLTLTATTYSGAITTAPGTQFAGSGDVIVNHTEIDFFNGGVCGLPLPDGVGRYKWTLTGGVLHFTPLNQDPCDRPVFLVHHSFYRKT
jgi:Fibronectin type III domain